MKRLLFAAMFSVLALGAAEIATPWNKVFESGKLDDSVKWRTRISLGEKDGQKFIQMGRLPRVAVWISDSTSSRLMLNRIRCTNW